MRITCVYGGGRESWRAREVQSSAKLLWALGLQDALCDVRNAIEEQCECQAVMQCDAMYAAYIRKDVAGDQCV